MTCKNCMDHPGGEGVEAGMMTDDRFGDATPLVEATKLQVGAKLAPLFAEGKTPASMV